MVPSVKNEEVVKFWRMEENLIQIDLKDVKLKLIKEVFLPKIVRSFST